MQNVIPNYNNLKIYRINTVYIVYVMQSTYLLAPLRYE